jgi:hypothetical protein
MKTMKKITYIGLIVSTFLLSGCTDVLKENPVDLFTAENYFDSDKKMVTGINGCYKQLTDGNYYGTNFRKDIEYYTDYCDGNGDGWQGGQAFVGGGGTSFNSDQTHIKVMWALLYSAIARSNGIISSVDLSKNTTELMRSRITGEARFLRALHYFNLVRCWGEVPLRKSVVKDYENEMHLAVSTRKEVFDFIIEDLKYAEQNCWNRKEIRAGNTNDVGRATQLAAKTLLAKVYLYIASSVRVAYTPGFTDNGVANINDGYKKGYVAEDAKLYYELCRDKCLEGVQHADFYMEPNYADLWKIENRFSKEVLFGTQYASSEGYYGALPNNYLPVYCTLGTQNATSSQEGNLKCMRPFLGVKEDNSSLLDFPVDTADLRFKEGFLMEYKQYKSFPTSATYNPAISVFKFEFKQAVTPFDWKYMRYVRYENGVRKTDSGNTKLYIKKFQDAGSIDRNSSLTGFPILRSADLYLMLGESQAEISGVPSDGYAALENARLRGKTATRIELSDVLINSYPQTNIMDKFREFIIRERMVEFAAEGDRLFTLFRMGCYLHKCQLVNKSGADNFPGDKANIKIRTWNSYWWPISQNEINGNKLITSQSPGY